ncbi:MAG: SLC13 family permease [Alphaproteobacteria bacterium]
MVEPFLLWGQPFQMWVVFLIIILALIVFATEKFSMELTSVGVIIVLLIFFRFFPIYKGDVNLTDSKHLLAGISNPALISVLSLLVIGQGIVRTGILDAGARRLMASVGKTPGLALSIALFVAMMTSGFLNNIPVVVIFIPILQTMSSKFNVASSRVMMALGFVAILGGMTTVVGSGTNLLVNTALIDIDLPPFKFFDFTVPGLVMALSGLAFCLIILPLLLPKRSPMRQIMNQGKQFLVEIIPGQNSELIGATPKSGLFTMLPGVTVQSISRGNETFLPPFEDYQIMEEDRFLIAVTREKLREAISINPWLVDSIIKHQKEETSNPTKGDPVLMDAMVVPQSRLINMHFGEAFIDHAGNCEIIGIKRRASIGRDDIRHVIIEAGDVLLLRGQREVVEDLRASPDVVPLEWSTKDLPQKAGAMRALFIFGFTMLMSSLGILPVEVATLIGATAMAVCHILTPNQTLKALDIKVALAIIAALAMGEALKASGGDTWLATQYIHLVGDVAPGLSLSIMFLVIALLSTVLTTKTAAVLFTPMAVQIAMQYNDATSYHVPWEPFAIAVVFAANCSFANPLGYKTNLLTMGPGGYKFLDYTRGGLPLTLFLWVVFSAFVPWYYGMPLF